MVIVGEGPSKRARLISFPPADGQFFEYAVKCYDFGIDNAAQLQAAIRVRYPKALVQPGRTDASGEMRWYVYRDEEAGAFEPPTR